MNSGAERTLNQVTMSLRDNNALIIDERVYDARVYVAVSGRVAIRVRLSEHLPGVPDICCPDIFPRLRNRQEVKFSHARHRALLRPELIPVYRQSARR